METATAQKGKNVGIWLSAQDITALTAACETRAGKIKEGTYCKDAVIQRLQREGFLKEGEPAGVAAQALELAHQYGPDRVKAKLLELATEMSAAQPQPLARAS